MLEYGGEDEDEDPASENGRVRTAKTYLCFLLVLSAALAVFAPSLNDFFWTDDFYWMEYAHDLHREGGLLNIVVPPPRSVMGYRPCNLILFRLCYALAELNPVPYHALLLAIHLLSCVALFHLFALLGTKHWVAGLAALFYAVSKPMGECARWLTGYHEVAGSLFYVLALIFLVRWQDKRKWHNVVGMATCLWASHMCKEDSISLPAVLALLWLWRWWRRENRDQKELRRFGLLCVLLACDTALYLWVIKAYSEGPGISLGIMAPSFTGRRELSFLLSFFLYFTEFGCFEPAPASAMFLLFGLLSLLLIRRRGGGTFYIIWTAVAALPLAVVLVNTTVLGLRHAHIPFLGYCAAVATGFVVLLSRWREGKLSVLELLLLAAMFEILVVGLAPLRSADVDLRMSLVPSLVGAWIIVFVALWSRHRSAGWIGLAPAIAIFKLVAFLATNTPWWVGCLGAWGLGVACASAIEKKRPSKDEALMAGVLAALAFGPLGAAWADLLLYSLAFGVLMWAPVRIRKCAYAVIIASMVGVPMYRRAREAGLYEAYAADHLKMVTTLKEQLPELKSGDNVVWVSESGNWPQDIFSPSGLVRCTQGFPANISVIAWQSNEEPPPATATVRYFDYDHLEVEAAR